MSLELLASELYCEIKQLINGIQPLVFRKHKRQEKNTIGPIEQCSYPSKGYVVECLDSLINLSVADSYKNNFIDITQIRNFSHAAQKGVTLKQNMWGEYPPSIVATYSGIHFSMVDRDNADIATDPILTPLLPDSVSTNGASTTILSKGNLHSTWLGNLQDEEPIILAKYLAKLEAFQQYMASQGTIAAWAKALKLSDAKSGSVTFMLWLRHMKDPSIGFNHSHNMSQEIFAEIFTALGHICRATYPGAAVHILLMGDPVTNVGDLRASTKKPNKSFAKVNITKAIGQLLGDTIECSIEDLRGWYGKVSPKANIAQQYAFHRYLKHQYQPKFIIGVESGNLDGFGYAGIPVISVEPTDTVESLPLSIIKDRIGNYTLMTPNWQLVNYGAGDNDALFRQYLYGAMLTFTYYRGILETDGLSTLQKQAKLFDCFRQMNSATLSESGKSSVPKLGKVDPSKGSPLSGKSSSSPSILGDGNCLFRAFSHAMIGNQNDHGHYRQRAAQYVLDHYTDTEIMAAHDYDKNTYRTTMPVIVKHDTITPRNHWGSTLELGALAIVFNVTIHLHNDYGPAIVFGTQGNVINLRYVNDNHYEVL